MREGTLLDAGARTPALRVLADNAVVTAQAPVADAGAAIGALAAGPVPLSLALLFIAPEGDPSAIAAEAAARLPGVTVIGCTTAGEIGSDGYCQNSLVAVGLARASFAVRSLLIPDLRGFDPAQAVAETVRMRRELACERPDWAWDFAHVIADGLARREDQLLAALRLGLEATPLFGGSAGDGLDFRRTFVLAEGRAHENAAVLTLVRSRCPVRVFKFDHLRPTDVKMVVTEADPERRLVREINAEPAAREYARLVGVAPGDLGPRVFAAHPVVVCVGGQHHVRAIQRVEPNGDLRFFSAIDEGLVLTLAEPSDIVGHMEAALAALGQPVAPAAILGCDCILRRLEVENTQAMRAMSRVLAAHNVVGFNTYGEQFNSVHVNQTFTGVAIYPPEGKGR
jgi:hypothetical protein